MWGRAQAVKGSQPAVVSLDKLSRPGKVEVLEVTGERGASRMLAQLDIRPGVVLIVHRQAPLGGPILVESGGTTAAVGRGLASKVKVRVLP